MNPPRVDPAQLAESLKGEVDAYFQAVMTAVNDAPDGQWIAGSEEQVRDLSADFRRSELPRPSDGGRAPGITEKDGYHLRGLITNIAKTRAFQSK